MWVIRMPDEDTEDLGPADWSNEVGAACGIRRISTTPETGTPYLSGANGRRCDCTIHL